MSWPLPQDINEAVQTPGLAFADPDLKAGQAVVGAHGLPLPRSGNFADVYQIHGADGRDWAVKCFTRPVIGLDVRYQKIGEALAAAGLPFTIGFTFLNEGIRVRGTWYPAVKMEWVEGLQLNQFIRENAARPAALEGLLVLWSRFARRLRESGIAHADLQHGNVLLVPGSKPGAVVLRLIDYDGMYVPALANRPSGECGHAAFQHPARVPTHAYSPDLDRFPHLVIASALLGLKVAGPALWDRYDTGDNVLFTEADFKNPAGSMLMRELWGTGHFGLQALIGNLAVACSRPIPQTPWLDQLAPEGCAIPASAPQFREFAAALGFAAPVVVPSVPAPPPLPASTAGPVDDSGQGPPAWVSARGTETGGNTPYLLVGIVAAIVLVGGVVAAITFLGGNISHEMAQEQKDTGQGPPAPTPPSADPPPSPRVTPPKLPGRVTPKPRDVVPPVTPPVTLPPRPDPPPVTVTELVPDPAGRGKARLPVPTDEALAKSEQDLRQAYKDDYARKQPADKKALAQKLVKLAGATGNNPADRFVLLRAATDLAAEANEPALAVQAIDELAKMYQVNAAALKLALAEKVLARTGNQAVLRTVADLAMNASDVAADADDYVTAGKLAQIATQAVHKGALGATAIEDADFRIALVRKATEAFAEIRPDVELLEDVPDDPEANLAVGRYRCFVQGRWEAGLRNLAKGSDPVLKSLAERDLKEDRIGNVGPEAGDLWWDYAQTAPDTMKRAAEARARFWYVRALPGLTGLPQVKVAARLGFTAGGVEYRPGLVVEFSSARPAIFKGKKTRIDPVIDFAASEFSDNGRPWTMTAKWVGVIVAPRPGRYRIILDSPDPARIRLGGRVILDTVATKGGRKETTVTLFDRPTPFMVDYSGLNTNKHTIRLAWVPFGRTEEELIPANVLFHDRKAESAIGK